MKTKIFTFKDFQAETISRKEQKTIIGGGDDIDPNDPRKNNGGNGNPWFLTNRKKTQQI